MKNIRFTAVLTALLMMTGCSDNAEVDIVPIEGTVFQTEYTIQEGDIQVTGEVTEIIGNEVTLELGEVTETERSFKGEGAFAPKGTTEGSETVTEPVLKDTEETSAEAATDNENTENSEKPNGNFKKGKFREGMELPEDFEMPEGGFEKGELPEGFEMPEGGFGNGKKPEGGFGGKMKGGSAEIEKSGETASYTIPVGMQISGAGGRNSDYSSISAGMLLRLTLNTDGYVVAAEIL